MNTVDAVFCVLLHTYHTVFSSCLYFSKHCGIRIRMQAEAELHYLMLNMFRILIHPSSGACDLFVELFHGLCCSGSMCVGVTLWFGCGDVVSVCRLRH